MDRVICEFGPLNPVPYSCPFHREHTSMKQGGRTSHSQGSVNGIAHNAIGLHRAPPPCPLEADSPSTWEPKGSQYRLLQAAHVHDDDWCHTSRPELRDPGCVRVILQTVRPDPTHKASDL
jgi:hypothetical protein